MKLKDLIYRLSDLPEHLDYEVEIEDRLTGNSPVAIDAIEIRDNKIILITSKVGT